MKKNKTKRQVIWEEVVNYAGTSRLTKQLRDFARTGKKHGYITLNGKKLRVTNGPLV